MESHRLQRTLPSRVGIDPKAVLRFVNSLEEKKLGIHSFMLLRHNKVAAEGWWNPMKPQYNHMLFSLSKSLTSTAVGFAVQENLLSIEDYVISFFKDKLPCEPCENMKKMKVKHLLGMCTGHSIEPPMLPEDSDWVYTFLTSYVDCEPGTKFLYNTFATYMLSAIIQKVSNATTYEYLKERLFEPLGFSDVWWDTCSKGISSGGFGFNCKTEDIAKFGTFILNEGKWEGKQLLNSSWIKEATAKQIDNKTGDNEDFLDWDQGYGYQFWRCIPKSVFRGDGAFGQYCIVMPEQDAVLAIQSGLDNMQSVLTDVWNILLPAMQDNIEEDTEAQNALEEKLTRLMYRVPEGNSVSPLAKEVSGRVYELSDNKTGITKLSFDFFENKVTVFMGENSYTAGIGYNQWIDGKTFFREEDENTFSSMYHHISCSGAWVNDSTFKFLLLYNRTTTRYDFEVKFHNNGITVVIERKFNFDEYRTTVFGW
jgi:CubicO group peptidase (beta-lactamase class C family)